MEAPAAGAVVRVFNLPDEASTTADRYLFAAIQRGDIAAFGVFHDRHVTFARGYATRVLRNEWLAEEVIQDAFANLWRRRATYDDALSSPLTWLMSIVRHGVTDCWRREGRLPVRVADSEARFAGLIAPDDVEQQIIVREQERDIRHRVESLCAEQRDVIELGYYGGLSDLEIARALDLPLGTAKGRRRLGLRHLRAGLGV